MTRTTSMNDGSTDYLPLPQPSAATIVRWPQRMRGIALIVLGSFIALALLAGLIELAPSALFPQVAPLFVAGVLAGFVFIAGGVQLLRRGQLGRTFKTIAAVVLITVLAALWRTRGLLG